MATAMNTSAAGKDTVCAPDIKLAQIDGLRLLALTQQNAGDQVARNDEKYAHAGGGELVEDAVSVSAFGQVAEDNESNRNRSQAVERWNALHLGIVR
jgi:hypothetical protein